MTRLSPHFVLSEFTKSATAVRLGIDNTPSPRVVVSLKRLAETILEPVRAHYMLPVRVTSGYRCLALNEALGSKPTSEHTTGNAADFEVPGVPNLDVALWIKDNLEYNQLIAEFTDKDDPAAGWVHCSFSDENRNQVLTIDKNGTREGI